MKRILCIILLLAGLNGFSQQVQTAPGSAPLDTILGNGFNRFPHVPTAANLTNHFVSVFDSRGVMKKINKDSVVGFITADNGITANTPTNVRWGGRLIQNTTVSGTNAYSITFDSTLFMVSGPSNDTGTEPISGAGTRMFFSPKRAAFRAGVVSSTQWDAANIGYYSVGLGNNAIASGQYSFAVQGGSNASGNTAIAMGDASVASGNSSFGAQGGNASGESSFALGNNTYTSGTSSFTLGRWLKSKSYGGTVIGVYNDTTNAASATSYNTANKAFQIGVGTADGARSNAMEVLFSGATRFNKYGIGTFGSSSPAYGLGVDASGNVVEYAAVETASGTYTPTLTNAVNVTSSTAFTCQYMRVGNVVTVSGRFSITFTTITTTSQLGISLPIASGFTAEEQVGGSGASNKLTSGTFAIRADATNDRAEFYAVAPGTALTETYWFSFTYLIVAA